MRTINKKFEQCLPDYSIREDVREFLEMEKYLSAEMEPSEAARSVGWNLSYKRNGRLFKDYLDLLDKFVLEIGL